MNESPRANKIAYASCNMLSLLELNGRGQQDIINSRNGNMAQMVKRITVYENLFSPTLSGEVEMEENLNLSTSFSEGLPAIGLEYFLLEFAVPNIRTQEMRVYGANPRLVFQAYSQVDRVSRKIGTHEYKLKLVSMDFGASIDAKISRRYTNVRAEDIIKDLLTNVVRSSKPFVDIEETRVPITMTIPLLTPFEAIKLVALQAQNPEQRSNYLFYETLDGFHFKSIARIIADGNAQKTSDRVSAIPMICQRLAGTQMTRNSDLMITADAMDIISGYNFLYAASQGFFGSTTYAVDILSGKCDEIRSHPWDDNFTQRETINGPNGIPFYPISKEIGRSISARGKILVVPTSHISALNTDITSKDNSVRNNFMAQTLDGRLRELTALQSRTIRVKVSGTPDIHAGSLVDIMFPNPANNNEFAFRNDVATGRYLVVSTKHTLTKSLNTGEYNYETLFEACSDSFAP